jgi:hypothetical protein
MLRYRAETHDRSEGHLPLKASGNQRARRGAFSAISLVAVLAGCQGQYPIAATRCDEWCRVTEPEACDFTSPSLCVKECEEGGFTTRCAVEFDVLFACREEHPSQGLPCLALSAEDPCQSKREAFESCVFTSPRE